MPFICAVVRRGARKPLSTACSSSMALLLGVVVPIPTLFWACVVVLSIMARVHCSMYLVRLDWAVTRSIMEGLIMLSVLCLAVKFNWLVGLCNSVFMVMFKVSGVRCVVCFLKLYVVFMFIISKLMLLVIY